MNISDCRVYVSECLSILYWSFFKPFTFRRWLIEINPDLDLTTNPFSLRKEFDENACLHRYANQTWWLVSLVPVLISIAFGLFWSVFPNVQFDWLRSSLFLVGWIVGWIAGLLLSKLGKGKLDNWFYSALLILSAFWVLRGFSGHFLPLWVQQLFEIPFQFFVRYSLLYFLAFGVAFGVSIVLGVIRF
ncbi:MAG: hypothetical protein ACLFN9_03255, partial [Desulfococcaceae bacterium]